MNDSPLVGDYNYRNCQSLFGYAAAVHEWSGGICQICGAGSSGIDFDLWRQLTVEHLIGEAQGGYLRQISAGLARRFPGLGATALARLAGRIDAANTVTACSFCNSMTSRNQAPVAMTDLIQHAPDGSPADIYEHVVAGLNAVLAAKKREVGWKLAAVRKAFDSLVAPRLAGARATSGVVSSREAMVPSDVARLVERILAEVAPEPAEFVDPPGYAHISLALVDAVYSIRLRYSEVRRVVAAYCQASGTPDQPLAARNEPGFRERGLDYLLDLAGGVRWPTARGPAVWRQPIPDSREIEGRRLRGGGAAAQGGRRVR